MSGLNSSAPTGRSPPRRRFASLSSGSMERKSTSLKTSTKLRPRSKLHSFQEQAATRIRQQREVAVLLRPGHGKTALTLTALRDAWAFPALVVAPARVAESVWKQEGAAWEHLAGLRIVPLVGSPLRRLAAMELRGDVEVVSYENLPWLLDTIDAGKRYDAIVFDELSKMKHPGTKRFKRLRHVVEAIRYRVGLTGTPVGNHLLDLFGEMFMVAGEKPLGPTLGRYRDRYFKAVKFHGFIPVKWALAAPTHEAEIFARCAPYTFTLPDQPVVRTPPVVLNRLDLPMPHDVQVEIMDLERELHVQFEDGIDLVALEASTLATKLRQYAGGAVYVNPAHDYVERHTEKIDAVRDLLDELQGAPAVIFYWYQHEKERLLAALKGREVASDPTPENLAAWNAGKLEALLLHPQGAGHGLNLQAGGSTIIWFTLPWSHELWVQANGRLARQGQQAPTVTAHVLMCGETDRRVLAALTAKGKTEERFMEATR